MPEHVVAQLDSASPASRWAFRAPPATPSITLSGSDPLRQLHAIQLPMSQRRLAYFSYDCGRLFERLPEITKDDLKLPMFGFLCFEPSPSTPRERVLHPQKSAHDVRTSTFNRDSFIRAIERVLEYIHAGDVYQVNLAQRFTFPLTDHPYDIYCRLREQAPAMYGAYLDFGDFQIISNSPELFLRVELLPDARRRVVTRPIKGTRQRSAGMDVELRESEKDRAELAMIVDVERNDLGRVCEIGSIRVVDPRVIEAHPTVYHGVATIEGILRRDVTFVDLLRATFPSGSVTGAPKIRAMQIIDELEPVRRGPYCGAIGYIDPDGSMEFNVAIRTMVVKDGQVHVSVGGGIVVDSNPVTEYEETLVKAKAMFAALKVGAEAATRV